MNNSLIKDPEPLKEIITNGDILMLWHNLNNLGAIDSISVNLSIHATLLNLKLIAPALMEDKIIPQMPEYIEYNKAMTELYKEFAKDDKWVIRYRTIQQGNDIYERPDVDFNNPELLLAKAEIEKKYERAILNRERQKELYTQFLNSPCTLPFTLHYIDAREIPLGGDQRKIWNSLRLLIKISEDK